MQDRGPSSPLSPRSSQSPPSLLSRRSVLGLSTAAALAPLLTACAPKVEPPVATERFEVERRFRFGLPAPIITLDPALASDVESKRVIRQSVQTLIGTDPSTGAPVPRLAQRYTVAEDGKSVEFRLRTGLTFHDGSTFNAASVRDTFERLHNLPLALVKAFPDNAFRQLFRAHAGESTASLYIGCDILADDTVVLKFAKPMTALIPALSDIGFGILSQAQTAERRAAGSTLPTAPADFLPIGTGPFSLVRASSEGATLSRFQSNQTARIAPTGIDFTVLQDEYARLAALLDGTVDAFDLVTPRMGTPLARSAQQMLTRDPYSLLYLGMNASHPVLKRPAVRKIVYRVLNRSQIINGQFLNGTKMAESFFPQRLGVTKKSTTTRFVSLTPAEAEKELKEAGYKGEPIEFVYPTGAPRIFLPYPEKTYAMLARQLQAAGLNIKPVPVPWSENFMSTMLTRTSRGFHLFGLNGGYLDPSYFANALFLDPMPEFGLKNAELATRLEKASTMENGPDRLEAYGEIAGQLEELLPAIPLVVPVSALAVAPGIAGVPISPVMDEVFSTVSFTT